MNVNSLINKLPFVINLLVEEDLSFLAICETWLIGEVPSSFVEIPGFSFLRRDVEGSVRKHGVGLYVKNNVEVVSVSADFPNVMEVYLPLWDLFLIVVYRPIMMQTMRQ